jgi:transcriptional regulator with XRE-family HTH domain
LTHGKTALQFAALARKTSIIRRQPLLISIQGGFLLMKRAPNPVDQHVGSRVRMRRVLLGMSQEKLAEALGLTFQQVQKYEKGTNRIGASRLQEISNTLQVTPSFFFEGLNGHMPVPANGFAEEASAKSVTDFVVTAEGLQLNKAFTQIADPKVRRRIIDLVIAVAGSQALPSTDDA